MCSFITHNPSLQLAKLSVEAQRVERELRDELANSVSKEASDADRSRISELEKAEAELRVEVSRCDALRSRHFWMGPPAANPTLTPGVSIGVSLCWVPLLSQTYDPQQLLVICGHFRRPKFLFEVWR